MADQVIALIPARSGSKRIPDKNIRLLGGYPLISYSIYSAINCGIFSRVVVSTDSGEYASIANEYGAEVPFLRPNNIAGEKSQDFEWIEYTLNRLQEEDESYSHFCILRPTSPFRQAETIVRAWNQFRNTPGIDSLRAVEKCSQHPGKMWMINGATMSPLLPFSLNEQPWHSNQYAALPEIYVQNASLEIARSEVVFKQKSISGSIIAPFITKAYEGFDINIPYDWEFAEKLVVSGEALLPEVKKKRILSHLA